jgi:DNA glycosylase AlkZ-like
MKTEINTSSISTTRLVNQQLVGSQFTSPRSIVSWMVAMQAQDLPMARWAVGIRLPGMTDEKVMDAFNRGQVLRTHLLRPTWHFVTPEDIYWLLELSAPQIIASQRARDRQLELSPEIYSLSNATIEQALKTHGQLTREELLLMLNTAGIKTDQNRSAHLLMRAELEKIICSGAMVRGKPSYALLGEKVSKPQKLSKEEALAELAMRYFTSRCPATVQDFSWWSGLSALDVRQGVEAVRSSFVQEELGGKTYLMPEDYSYPTSAERTLFLLPTYDEFLISYANRSASIQPHYEYHMKEISDRGIFWPVIVIDGQVEGIWKRKYKKESLIVEILPFSQLDEATLALIDRAAAQYACFQDKNMTIIRSLEIN